MGVGVCGRGCVYYVACHDPSVIEAEFLESESKWIHFDEVNTGDVLHYNHNIHSINKRR